MASYSSVVSRRGATPSSRSNSATSSRYWRIAPAAVAGAGEQLDEPALPELVERIELDPPPRRLHRPARIPTVEPSGRKSIEEVTHGPLDAHGAGGLPIVERRAVAQREAGQERAPGERRRSLKVGRPERCRQALQFDQIDGCGRRVERDLCPPDDHTGSADRGAQRRQRTTKGTPGGLVVRLRPEHRRQLVAGERPSAGSDKGDDRERLAGVHHDGAATHGHVQGAEQPDGEGRRRADHDVTVLDDGRVP